VNESNFFAADKDGKEQRESDKRSHSMLARVKREAHYVAR